MKLTSLQFTLVVATLCVVAGGAYKAGQDSRPPVMLVHPIPEPEVIWHYVAESEPAPVPETNSAPPNLACYTVKTGIYYHDSEECMYQTKIECTDDRFSLKISPMLLSCPRCVHR